MSSLWIRANGPQYRLLRIVAGAVLNTAHAHPNQMPDRKFARGVAKRAVGTLSSQLEVLASATKPASGNAEGKSGIRRSRRFGTGGGDRGAAQLTKPRPFSKLCDTLGKRVKPLRIAGDIEAADAVIAAIRCLAPLVRRERGKPNP